MTFDGRKLDRRQFVTALIASGAAAAVPTPSIDGICVPCRRSRSLANPRDTKVDFRYAPRNQQSTICFPDDPRKTIVGQTGDLRYGFAKSFSAGMENFSTRRRILPRGFSGRQNSSAMDRVSCRSHRAHADRPSRGDVRTDRIRNPSCRRRPSGQCPVSRLSPSRTNRRLTTSPSFRRSTSGPVNGSNLRTYTVPTATVRAHGSKSPLLVAAQLNSNLGSCMLWEEEGFTLYLPHGEACRRSRRHVISSGSRRKTNQPKPLSNICTMPKCFWPKLASSGEIGNPLEPRTGTAQAGTGNFLLRARATFNKRARSRMIGLSFRLVLRSIAVCGLSTATFFWKRHAISAMTRTLMRACAPSGPSRRRPGRSSRKAAASTGRTRRSPCSRSCANASLSRTGRFSASSNRMSCTLWIF